MADYYLIVTDRVNAQGRTVTPAVYKYPTAQEAVDTMANLLRENVPGESIFLAKSVDDASYVMSVNIKIPSEGVDMSDPVEEKPTGRP